VLAVPRQKVKALVYQARSALIAQREARDTPCEEIREQLATATGGVLRRGPLRRHLRACDGCREFRAAVAGQRVAVGALLPVAPSAALLQSPAGAGAAGSVGGVGVGAAGGVA